MDYVPQNATLATWHNHTGPVLDAKDGFEVIDCAACGFKHIIPIPTVEELEKLYRESFYQTEKPTYLADHEEDADWWDQVYAERYELMEGWLGPNCRRLLDVGSGPGLFIRHGVQRGWRCVGLEPSAMAAEYSRGLGLDVRQRLLDANSSTELAGSFDALNLSKVLEHVPDPAATLGLARTCLADGGVLCLVVPNEYNPFQQVLRKICGYRPWWLVPPHHINYFDVESLKTLVRRTGFDLLNLVATFPIDLFLLMGDNYVDDPKLGRACHGRRKTFETNLVRAGRTDLLRDLYRAMGALGIGRELVLYARRSEG